MERSLHSLVLSSEKHFFPKADLQQGTTKSVLVLLCSLLHESDDLLHIFLRERGSSLVSRYIHHF